MEEKTNEKINERKVPIWFVFLAILISFLFGLFPFFVGSISLYHFILEYHERAFREMIFAFFGMGVSWIAIALMYVTIKYPDFWETSEKPEKSSKG